MKKIYLDVDEEIVSVVDRLKEEEDSEISLVVPKESGLVQSVVNLKLIKKQAEKLEKTITIITANRVGKSLAENVGLNVLSAGVERAPEKEEPKVGDKVEIDFLDEPKEETEFKKDEADEVLIKEEEKEEEKKEDETLEPKDKAFAGKKRFRVNGFFVFLSLIFLGIFIFGYIYIPRATILVKVRSEKKSFEADLTLDKKEPETKVDSGIITAELIEVEKESNKKFVSTGKKNIGTKAKGQITVKNNFSTSSQTLVSGTRFESNGLTFKSTESVTVPGYTDPGGGKVAGSINVSVEADEVGSQYNIGPSSFNLPGLQGTGKYDQIKGASTSSMTGGESREVKIVTQGDVNKAVESFAEQSKEEAKKEMKSKAKKDFSITDETSEVKIISTNTSPAVGAEGGEFILTLKVSAKGLAYNEKDIENVFKKKAQDEVGTYKQVVDSGLNRAQRKITKLDLENGNVNLNIKTDLYLGTVVDSKAVQAEIMGQTEKKSLEYLKNLENVEEASIKFWPGFIKRVPRLERHVIIKTEAIKFEEDKKE